MNVRCLSFKVTNNIAMGHVVSLESTSSTLNTSKIAFSQIDLMLLKQNK